MSKSFTIKFFAALLVMVLMLAALWAWCISEINNLDAKASSKIGQSVVVGKDTLTIVDYNMIQSTYTLSNGTQVAFQYVDKN